jgi:hypothetical protein
MLEAAAVGRTCETLFLGTGGITVCIDRLQAGWPGLDSPRGRFFFRNRVLTGSCPMGAGGSFSKGKAAGS